MRSCCKQQVGLLSEFLNRIDKTNHFNVNTSKKWVNDTFWHLRLNPGRELPGLSLNMLYISRMRWSILNQRMGYYHFCKKIKKNKFKIVLFKICFRWRPEVTAEILLTEVHQKIFENFGPLSLLVFEKYCRKNDF